MPRFCQFYEDDYTMKKRRKGICLPPEDFVYGCKYAQKNGVAEALQYHDPPMVIHQSMYIPDFISINKTAARLGLTKVRDIHEYRRMISHYELHSNRCFCPPIKNQSIVNMIHGRVTEKQTPMRDLIENKYLHEWLRKMALRRCK